MGLWDYIRCELPLKAEGLDTLDFQTKSFDCSFEDYRITAGGNLERLEFPAGDWLPHQLNGTVEFYAPLPNDGWIEFRADFENGLLTRIYEVLDVDAVEVVRELARKGG